MDPRYHGRERGHRGWTRAARVWYGKMGVSGRCGAGARVLALVLAEVGAVSCLPQPVYDCAEDEHCVDLGPTARCEPVGYCSELDPGCGSGRRFHGYAGDGLAGQCTDVTCGNGLVQPGEDCDDANDIDGDGCNSDCRASGQELLKVGYASPGDLRDRCYSIAVDSEGNAAVIGHVTVEGQGENLWVRRYDVDGKPGWTWVLDGDAHVDEEGWSIVALAGDEWLVAGSVATLDALENAWVGRLNRDGILVWDAQWDGGEAYIDVARDVVLAPDGDVVVIGYATVDRNRETDLWFQRRSPDGQAVVWTQHRAGLEDNAQDRGHGLARVPGGFVGVGVKQTIDSTRFWVEHLDEAGATVWADEGGPGDPNAVLTAVAATPAGHVLLAGWKASPAGDEDMWLQERGPGGEVLWDETVASPGGDADKANAIVVDERGGFVVGGEMGAGAGSTDAWIRRYAPDRSEVWTVSYSGPAGDRDTTWGLALAPDGAVWACGYESSPGTEWDIWVRHLTP
jgi:cysteine-rich repeat protein